MHLRPLNLRTRCAALGLTLLATLAACGDDASTNDDDAQANAATASTNTSATNADTTPNTTTQTANGGTSSDSTDVEAIRAACEAATAPEQCAEAASGTAYCVALGEVYRLDANSACALVPPASPCAFIPVPLNGAAITAHYRSLEGASPEAFEATNLPYAYSDAGPWARCSDATAPPVCACAEAR